MDTAIENRIDTEVAPGGKRIVFETSVATNGGQRTHRHILQRADPRDQRIGHSELEGFIALAPDNRFERQHCEAPVSPAAHGRTARQHGENDEDHSHGDEGHGPHQRSQTSPLLPLTHFVRERCDPALFDRHLHRLCLADRNDELVPAARNRGDDPLTARLFGQSLAKGRDLKGEASFVDDRIGPHFSQDRFLVHDDAAAFHESGEQVERLRCQRDGLSFPQKSSSPDVERERSEEICRCGRHLASASNPRRRIRSS